MAHRHKHHKASGGPARKEYDAVGSNVMKEEHEKKKGGAVTRAEGGKVPGRASGGRLDKRARGGRAGKDMTSSPFSAAHIAGHMKAGNPSVHKG